MLNSEILLFVLLCCAVSTIVTQTDEPRPSEFTCPISCDCDKLNYYEATTCSRNGSSLELILRKTWLNRLPPNYWSVPGNNLIVNCKTAHHFVYEILREFNFVNLVIIQYNDCPLPLGKSFSQIHSGLREFQFNTTEHISIGGEYFNGLRHLRQLYLRSSSTIDLTDDVITGLPYLYDLTIISNEINEKIFDHPSNMTFLRVGGINNEFNAEGLKEWSRLRWFSLTDSKIRHLSKSLTANLPNISRVMLKFNEITTFDSDTFESLHQLQSIMLINNKIANMPQRLIVKSESFEFIRIECDEETGFDKLPDEFLSNIPNLSSIEIVGCNMTSVPENLFKSSTNIRKIELSSNLLTDLPENFLADQNELANIDLSSNRFTKISDKFLETLLTKPVWHRYGFSISFAMNKIERLSRKHISFLSQFNGFYNFGENSITDLSGFDDLVKTHEGSFITVERNPINCDCLSVNAFKSYAKVTSDYHRVYIRKTICATPSNLNVTAVIDVKC